MATTADSWKLDCVGSEPWLRYSAVAPDDALRQLGDRGRLIASRCEVGNNLEVGHHGDGTGSLGRSGPGGPVLADDGPASDGDPDDATELLDEVEKAAQQVFIARKFYNDVAGRTLDARRRPLARVLHLSGGAPPPEFFDMDDEVAGGD